MIRHPELVSITGAAFSAKREVCKILNTSVLDFLHARCCRRLRCAAVCFALAPRAGFTSFTRRPSENPLQDDRNYLLKNTIMTFNHSPSQPSPSRGRSSTSLFCSLPSSGRGRVGNGMTYFSLKTNCHAGGFAFFFG